MSENTVGRQLNEAGFCWEMCGSSSAQAVPTNGIDNNSQTSLFAVVGPVYKLYN